MSSITKEWLQKAISQNESMRDEIPFGWDEDDSNTLAAMKLALASLEAEAVAYVMADDLKDSSIISTPAYRDLGEAMERTVGDVVSLYAAPPAPVSVPKVPSSVTAETCNLDEPGHDWNEAEYYAQGWNACRDAMLQGADGNSPVIPDCSCRTCRPVTFNDSRFVVCPECGNKRCPYANDHRNACTGSNEPGQEGSAYPAAPQQEVKP